MAVRLIGPPSFKCDLRELAGLGSPSHHVGSASGDDCNDGYDESDESDHSTAAVIAGYTRITR